MDKEEVKKWMQQIGKDRTWLAEQIGCTVGTLNQWFSKLGFPDWAQKSINRLMNPTGDGDSGIEVTFTAREFERIEQARKLLGIATRKLFYEEAIISYTDQTLAAEAGEKTPGDGKITPFITAPQVKPSKVAEKHRGKNGTED